MSNNNISWLTTVPASDMGFKWHLKTATKDEIETAISILQSQRRIVSGVPIGNKTKIAALERELRKRVRTNYETLGRRECKDEVVKREQK